MPDGSVISNSKIIKVIRGIQYYIDYNASPSVILKLIFNAVRGF